jgi:hypothetical protein
LDCGKTSEGGGGEEDDVGGVATSRPLGRASGVEERERERERLRAFCYHSQHGPFTKEMKGKHLGPRLCEASVCVRRLCVRVGGRERALFPLDAGA